MVFLAPHVACAWLTSPARLARRLLRRNWFHFWRNYDAALDNSMRQNGFPCPPFAVVHIGGNIS